MRRNWSQHVEFSSGAFAEPESVHDLQRLVASSPRIRALGTGHSFNALADTSGIHVGLARMPMDVQIESARSIAWVPAGMRYGQAAAILDSEGLALANMASLGHISVAGTISTGTHGSGDRNQTLSAAVMGLELVTATGDVVEIDAGSHDRAGAVVSLGALGILTRVGLRVEPAFSIRQHVFDGIRHDEVQAAFDEIFASAYSVSFFTTWGPDLTGAVWSKQRDDRSDAFPPAFTGRHAAGKRHPLPGHDPVNCTDQAGVPGSWHERLPHFRLDFTPSSGDELQTEYLVPRDRAVTLMRDLEALAPHMHPLLFVSEIRTVAADDLWLSGAYGRETVAFHFTWHRDLAVLALLPALDDVLGGFGGRPHWGKLYASPAARIAEAYPRFADFVRLSERMDPTGKFRNPMVTELISASGG